MKLNIKEQIMMIFRNASAVSLIFVSYLVIFSVLQINIELDEVLAFLLLLIIMFCLFVVISMMYLISIREKLRKIDIRLNSN